MAKKMLNPRTTLWALDEADVLDIRKLTASDLNQDGLNISCAVVRGYTLNPTASDTDNSASICDEGNVDNRLYDNYEGEISMFRDGDVGDAVSIYNKAHEYFKIPDRRFYIIRRLGKKNTAAAVDGDEVEAFLFVNDHLRSIDGGDDGPIQFTVPLLQQGDYTGYFRLGGSNPVIIGASPANAEEGQTLTLTGSGFTGATAVTIDGTPGTELTVVSDGSLTFKVPAGTAGAVDIIVTTPVGSSAAYSYTRGD